MKKRIYGLENEFGIAFTCNGRRTLPSEKVVRYLFEKLNVVVVQDFGGNLITATIGAVVFLLIWQAIRRR